MARSSPPRSLNLQRKLEKTSNSPTRFREAPTFFILQTCSFSIALKPVRFEVNNLVGICHSTAQVIFLKLDLDTIQIPNGAFRV